MPPKKAAVFRLKTFRNVQKGMLIFMQDLLIALAKGLVEDKGAVKVSVDEPNEEGVIVYHLNVAPDDMGRVIGKQGRIAKAIRVVMRSCAAQRNEKIMVEID